MSTLIGRAGRADRVGFGGRAALGGIGGGDLGTTREEMGGRNGDWRGQKRRGGFKKPVTDCKRRNDNTSRSSKKG